MLQTKYEVVAKAGKSPHVVVVMNQYPPMHVLSCDRWHIVDLFGRAFGYEDFFPSARFPQVRRLSQVVQASPPPPSVGAGGGGGGGGDRGSFGSNGERWGPFAWPAGCAPEVLALTDMPDVVQLSDDSMDGGVVASATPPAPPTPDVDIYEPWGFESEQEENDEWTIVDDGARGVRRPAPTDDDDDVEEVDAAPPRRRGRLARCLPECM